MDTFTKVTNGRFFKFESLTPHNTTPSTVMIPFSATLFEGFGRPCRQSTQKLLLAVLKVIYGVIQSIV